ncbi:MAG: hypothetical protein V4692_07625 [Bdellovibrionota bacterium]
MKSFLIAAALLVSAPALATTQSAHLEGSMTFMSDMKTIPVQIDLTLKKDKSEKATYKGKLSYTMKGKARSRTIYFEIDREDGETTAMMPYDFGRLEFEGGVISLTTGSKVSMQMTYMESGGERCIPHDICIPNPDRVVDQGTLDMMVVSAD